jgi:hypothetical protein
MKNWYPWKIGETTIYQIKIIPDFTNTGIWMKPLDNGIFKALCVAKDYHKMEVKKKRK